MTSRARSPRRTRGASAARLPGMTPPRKRPFREGAFADHRGRAPGPPGRDALVIATIAGVPTRDDDAVSIPPLENPTHVLIERASAGDRVRWRFLRHAPDDASAPDRDPDPDGLAWRAERPPTEDAAVAFIALVRDGTLAVVGPADPSGALSVGVTSRGDRRSPVPPRGGLPAAARTPGSRGARVARAAVHQTRTRRRGNRDGVLWVSGRDPPGRRRRWGRLRGRWRDRPRPRAPVDARRGASSRCPRGDTPALRDVYDAARPPRDTPPLEGDFPELVPTPRPYQRRAVGWMVRRERGRRRRRDQTRRFEGRFVRRLGRVSRVRDAPVVERASHGRSGTSSVRQLVHGPDDVGSIPASARRSRRRALADEMGLGKTVELLMCVLANKYVPEKNERDADDDGGEDFVQGEDSKLDGDVVVQGEDSKLDGDVVVQGEDSKLDVAVKREASPAAEAGAEKDSKDSKDEVVNCACGATDADYEGMWLACDDCGGWSHARCVGYTKTDERRHFRRVAAAREAADDARDAARRFAADARAADARADESEDVVRDSFERAAEEAEKAAIEAAIEAESTESTPFSCGACVARKAGETFSGPCGATLVVCPARDSSAVALGDCATRQTGRASRVGVRGSTQRRGRSRRGGETTPRRERVGRRRFGRLRARFGRGGRRAHHVRRASSRLAPQSVRVGRSRGGTEPTSISRRPDAFDSPDVVAGGVGRGAGGGEQRGGGGRDGAIVPGTHRWAVTERR